jgi:AbrB family transcriptional regulator, transcriptional pleiotropic regulator of transition state genes
LRVGFIRAVDAVGRISLPLEYRQLLTIAEGDSIAVTEHDGRIKLESIDSACIFCREREQLLAFKNRMVCQSCLDEIAAPMSV